MKHVVDVADLVVSKQRSDMLITYALGSCLGVTAYDRVAGVGGLLHCQLPAAPRGAGATELNVAQFVDTGVIALMSQCFALGAEKSRLVIAVAGGADVMRDLANFKIAHRNHAVLRKILWKNSLLIAAEDVGGTHPRTMSIDLCDGAVRLQSGTRRWELIPATGSPDSGEVEPVPVRWHAAPTGIGT